MEFETQAEGFEPDLTQGPGFLIRRLHQIHLALFAEECTGFDLTPVQYAILSVIARRAGMDQSQISGESGIDRAALAKIIARLESTGFLHHITSQLDRRQKLLSLTSRARTMLSRMQEPVARAHARTIGALSAADQATFLSLLATLVDAGNPIGRPKPRLK
jgi:DNA-binding MarR family transcriptional regulator